MNDLFIVTFFSLCAMSMFLMAFALGSAAVMVALKGWPAVNPFPPPRRAKPVMGGNPFPVQRGPLLDPAPGPMPPADTGHYVDEDRAIRDYEQFKRDIAEGTWPDVEMLEA